MGVDSVPPFSAQDEQHEQLYNILLDVTARLQSIQTRMDNQEREIATLASLLTLHAYTHEQSSDSAQSNLNTKSSFTKSNGRNPNPSSVLQDFIDQSKKAKNAEETSKIQGVLKVKAEKY